MEPPAPAAVSPDPTPQEVSSPAKRSPWKHPAPNGVVDPGVMDANHWPALSETAKATSKPAPSLDSSRPPDSATAPVASSAVANSSSSSQKHHGRHKSARRGGATGGDHSPRDHPDRAAGGWDHGGGGRGGQRNHNNGGGRRGNGGGGPGGFSGRRGRGGYEGFYRGPPPMGMGPYMRGAPPPPPPMAVPPPFMGPPPPVSPMRAFAGQMVFHHVSPMYYFGPPPPPEALRGMALAPPMVGPPAYPYFQAPLESQPDSEADAQENQAKLLKQIEFYFSKDNLCTDVFLRRKMDDQGWVDISLIANFKKVQELTNDLQYIKETVQSSSILEIQDDKIRRQNDWNKWVIPRESNPDIASSSASVTGHPNVQDLTAQLGGVGLHQSASSSGMGDENHQEVLQNGSPSGNDQSPVVEDNSGHQ